MRRHEPKPQVSIWVPGFGGASVDVAFRAWKGHGGAQVLVVDSDTDIRHSWTTPMALLVPDLQAADDWLRRFEGHPVSINVWPPAPDHLPGWALLVGRLAPSLASEAPRTSHSWPDFFLGFRALLINDILGPEAPHGAFLDLDTTLLSQAEMTGDRLRGLKMAAAGCAADFHRWCGLGKASNKDWERLACIGLTTLVGARTERRIAPRFRRVAAWPEASRCCGLVSSWLLLCEASRRFGGQGWLRRVGDTMEDDERRLVQEAIRRWEAVAWTGGAAVSLWSNVQTLTHLPPPEMGRMLRSGVPPASWIEVQLPPTLITAWGQTAEMDPQAAADAIVAQASSPQPRSGRSSEDPVDRMTSLTLELVRGPLLQAHIERRLAAPQGPLDLQVREWLLTLGERPVKKLAEFLSEHADERTVQTRLAQDALSDPSLPAADSDFARFAGLASGACPPDSAADEQKNFLFHIGLAAEGMVRRTLLVLLEKLSWAQEHLPGAPKDRTFESWLGNKNHTERVDLLYRIWWLGSGDAGTPEGERLAAQTTAILGVPLSSPAEIWQRLHGLRDLRNRHFHDAEPSKTPPDLPMDCREAHRIANELMATPGFELLMARRVTVVEVSRTKHWTTALVVDAEDEERRVMLDVGAEDLTPGQEYLMIALNNPIAVKPLMVRWGKANDDG